MCLHPFLELLVKIVEISWETRELERNIQRLENENALLIAERMRLQRLRDANGLNAENGSNEDINENDSSSEQQQPAEAGQADSSATSVATTSQNPKN